MIPQAVFGLALALGVPTNVSQDTPALRGLDPVELAEGRAVEGDPKRAIERGGFRYVFAGDASRARFEAQPERFEIQMGGGCGRMGPLSGSCSADRFAVHDGRIYVFASDACRASFLKSPEKHVDRDDPPLEADEKAVARGRELLRKALAGLGGADAVDGVRAVRIEKKGVQKSGGKEYATRSTRIWRLPDDLRHESAWDEWVSVTVAASEDAFSGGKELDDLHPAGRKELRRQMGREPFWLLRHRNEPGFTAAEGSAMVGATTDDVLVVRYEGAVTKLWLDPALGRVKRAVWRGRVDSGPNGFVDVHFSDFSDRHEASGGLVLPRAREVWFDGERVEAASGPLDAVEVDPVLGGELFRRAK